MEFKRKTSKINLAGTSYIIRELVPADFLGEDCWPLKYYHLKGEDDLPENPWSKWEVGIKPRWMLEAEARIRKIIAFGIASPEFSPNEIVGLCQDDKMAGAKNLLVGMIFSLSYGITDVEQYAKESSVSRKHLIEIGIKARELCREPWEIMFGTDGLPEGFNPKRYDFNTLVLSVMFERDSEISSRRFNG